MADHNGMPDNPGDPEHTDPEATSADRAESAAEEARAAQASGSAEELDPTLESDLEEALADVEADLDATEDGAEAEAAAADAASDAEASAEPTVEEQLAERTEDLQRLNAEYTNYRRRTERERSQVIETAKAQVLGQFLPILDDLALARQHGDLEDGPLKSISDKLVGVLTAQKVEAFGVEGDAFDPEIHEAVQDLSSGSEQVIGTVLRQGYRVGEKLIRTAMVIIADPAEQAESATDAE
ncbi:nucleotide exchange factor GrpE [Corynebacterium phoceense]|uniref:nucleotide exchange factor GrpE n=1 Tax=Corynebacterium phoceense TaxID=1686286 RepID=UPI001DD898AC|nr:nucleotide exchange factor GrpE [Corynebacterium phoceense]MCQ9333964.1 nucleotide exchange factor GrpE [Corynebacterium phoceense]HJG43526.1 nucleotide exchange factor GrpE [Corynebacterium phoceense]